jgi:hypothetical protein
MASSAGLACPVIVDGTIVLATMAFFALEHPVRKFGPIKLGRAAEKAAPSVRQCERPRVNWRRLHARELADLRPCSAMSWPTLQNLRQEITNITETLTLEFTRLYRKRNMVVHGGQIHGANLHSISETLTPLIGAGIDRIVHAELQFGVPPIELSAIAEARVDCLRPTASDRAAAG